MGDLGRRSVRSDLEDKLCLDKSMMIRQVWTPASGGHVVRSALAMVRLLNREARDDPDAPARRSHQRAEGETVWVLNDDLVADDLRGVLPGPSPAPGLDDYDRPIPMDEPDTEDFAEVPARLSILRVG